MAEINTTINIRDQNGQLIALNKNIKKLFPVASKPSILDEITVPSGKGYTTGDLIKKIRRDQVSSTTNTKSGGLGGFVGASSQNVHTVFIGKTFREDQIIWNTQDISKLSEGKNGNLVALEAWDFLITAREKDLRDLLVALKTQAGTVKLFTAVDANFNATGNQPAASGGAAAGSTANVIVDINAGKRINVVTNFDDAKTTRLTLIRECINYLWQLGSPNSPESGYLFSINGFGLDDIKVLTNYKGAIKIKDEDTVNFINVSANVQRNVSGMIGTIDNIVKVILTPQLPDNTEYGILTNRVLTRDLDTTTQYIGDVLQTGAIVDREGNTRNLKPNEYLLRFYQGRSQGVVYPTEFFSLDRV